jgi:hypothetical protein
MEKSSFAGLFAVAGELPFSTSSLKPSWHTLFNLLQIYPKTQYQSLMPK